MHAFPRRELNPRVKAKGRAKAKAKAKAKERPMLQPEKPKEKARAKEKEKERARAVAQTRGEERARTRKGEARITAGDLAVAKVMGLKAEESLRDVDKVLEQKARVAVRVRDQRTRVCITATNGRSQAHAGTRRHAHGCMQRKKCRTTFELREMQRGNEHKVVGPLQRPHQLHHDHGMHITVRGSGLVL